MTRFNLTVNSECPKPTDLGSRLFNSYSENQRRKDRYEKFGKIFIFCLHKSIGKRVTLIEGKPCDIKTSHVALRIFCSIASIVILPLTLIGIFLTALSKTHKKAHQKAMDSLKSQPFTKSEKIDQLQNDVVYHQAPASDPASQIVPKQTLEKEGGVQKPILSPFDALPNEVLHYLLQYTDDVGSVQFTNKKFYNASARCFQDANKEIARLYPPLKEVLDRKEFTDPRKLFMQFMNRLHDEAKRLDCDLEVDKDTDLMTRTRWELSHFRTLISKINERTKLVKAGNFKQFVSIVAREMEIDLRGTPLGTDEDVHNLWRNLLRHPSFSNVKELSLGDSFYFLPPEIGELKQLTVLDLINSKLQNLPPEIAKLGQLTKLYLHANKLQNLPPGIAELKQLTELDLGFNKLQNFPLEILELKQLTHLNLSRSGLQNLPPEIGELKQLCSLVLDHNKLQNLPPEIGNLKQLTYLSLCSNELEIFPPEIVKLEQLNHLLLSNNKLRILPPEIGKLQHLDVLDLENNKLQNLPPEIFELKRVTLDLQHNELQNLSLEIDKLKQQIRYVLL